MIVSLLNEVLRDLQQRQSVPLSPLPVPGNAVPGPGSWADLQQVNQLVQVHKKSRIPFYGVFLASVPVFLFWVSGTRLGYDAEVKDMAFHDNAVSAGNAVAPDYNVPGVHTSSSLSDADVGNQSEVLAFNTDPADAHVNTMANSQVSNLVSVSPQQGGEKTRSPTTGISPESVIVAPENRPSVKQSVDAGHFQKAGPQQVNLLEKAGLLISSRSYTDALAMLSADFYTDWKLRLLKAQAYLGAGSTELAENTLMTAYPLVSTAPEYFALLAGVKQKLRKYSEAEAIYLQLLGQNPNVGEWWIGLAITRDQTEQQEAASMAYEQGLSRGLASDSLRTYAQNRLLLLTQK